jgi:hypothetical protein
MQPRHSDALRTRAKLALPDIGEGQMTKRELLESLYRINTLVQEGRLSTELNELINDVQDEGVFDVQMPPPVERRAG